MNKESIFRTAAIMLADNAQIVNIKTSHKKIIESILVENENAELSIHQIIDKIRNELDLTFDQNEIFEIVKQTKHGFQLRYDNGEGVVKLSAKRFNFLKTKLESSGIEKYIQEFIDSVNTSEIKNAALQQLLFRFLYELLNTNILAFKKITDANIQVKDVSVDPTLFTVEERNAINNFLSWDSPEKNKALFTLISYCIEYSLISNNINSTSLLLKALRSKSFYLDNNIIYRAIGINGEDRKNRVIEFLKRCRESGQNFFISKYTIQEFNQTIKHNIKLLQKVPFGKINPSLFSKYSVNPSIYEFYHAWRDGRISYGFDAFYAHILSLYQSFKDQFQIDEDYKTPFDESSPEIGATIDSYREDIRKFKEQHGRYRYFGDDTYLVDAQNIYFIESKRAQNNRNITDTKFYYVSADQLLRRWDFSRSKNQPIALLPTQWMAIILKYFSRTDDDYKSFVSFLKLRQDDPIVKAENLQIILAGISEITEDYGKQSSILDQMAKVKFEGILDPQNDDEMKRKAALFSQRLMDEEIDAIKEQHKKELAEELRKQAKTANESKLEFNMKLLEETEQSIRALEHSAIPLERRIKNRVNAIIRSWILGVILYLALLIFLIKKFTWDVMEPIAWIGSISFVILGYVYIIIKGKSFNLLSYVKYVRANAKAKVYSEFYFDDDRLRSLKERKKELSDEIDLVKKT